MKFNHIAVVVLVLFALIVVDIEGSEPMQFCAPDCFDWLIDNCPTSSPSRKSVTGHKINFRRTVELYRFVARGLHEDCCGQPGCTEETVIRDYC